MVRADDATLNIKALSMKAPRAGVCKVVVGSVVAWTLMSASLAFAAGASDALVSAPDSQPSGAAAVAMAAQLRDEHATSAVVPAGADARAGMVAASAVPVYASPSAETSGATASAPIAASLTVGDPHDPVYLAFGGKEGIRTIVNDLYAELLVDPRTKSYFDGAPIDRIERLLTEQICSLLNGPCVYTGRSMRRTHAGQNIDRAAFDALVEDLEDAMDKHGVPYRYQTRLLAKLAPMYRDVQDRP